MCGAETQQFHPWIKPMKRVPNKSLKQLQQIYPNWKEEDLETLDKIITDRELIRNFPDEIFVPTNVSQESMNQTFNSILAKLSKKVKEKI